MAKYKDPNSWQYGGVKKRDFNQSHDGPEAMPHKKKSKKSGRKRARCKHEYKITSEVSWTSYSNVMHFTNFKCSKCGHKDYKITYE